MLPSQPVESSWSLRQAPSLSCTNREETSKGARPWNDGPSRRQTPRSLPKRGSYCGRLRNARDCVLGTKRPQRPYRAASGRFTPASLPEHFSHDLATDRSLRQAPRSLPK